MISGRRSSLYMRLQAVNPRIMRACGLVHFHTHASYLLKKPKCRLYMNNTLLTDPDIFIHHTKLYGLQTKLKLNLFN